MNILEYLASVEKDYSEEYHTIGAVWNGPGYHSLVPNGTWVHSTRAAFDYALLLLRSGEPKYISRAAETLSTVLSYQDTNPTSNTYGIFPWLMEEPLEQMSPPDWNWADFCGARIAQILQDHSDMLPADLTKQLRSGLGHAAWSIFRRNIDPGYTNIAFMGAAVSAAAGEMLDEPRLIEYARQRIKNMVDHTNYHGGLNEYNSPCYTFVALHECERIMQLVKDEEVRENAEQMRRFIWQSLADHFHPGTAQLAGPHSRSYSDLLRIPEVNYLAEQTSIEIPCYGSAPEASSSQPPSTLKHLPCPVEFVDRFKQLPQDDYSFRCRFIRREPDEKSAYGVTWFSPDATLGSISYDNLWTQRRPVLGYWKADDDIAVFRLRFLHDGKDFASAWSCNAQQGNKLLSAVGLLTDKGDYHDHLDMNEDAVFTAKDFRLRYELAGAGCSAKELAEGIYELAAGDNRAVIKPVIAKFNGRDVSWQITQEDNAVYLDAICYSGEPQKFCFHDFDTTIFAAAVELLNTPQRMTDQPIELDYSEDSISVRWPIEPNLNIQCCSRPCCYGE